MIQLTVGDVPYVVHPHGSWKVLRVYRATPRGLRKVRNASEAERVVQAVAEVLAQRAAV